MNLTKDMLEQFVKQGTAVEKLMKTTGNKHSKNSILLKQLKQTKKLLNKVR